MGWWKAWRAAARNRASASTCFYCGVAFASDESSPRQRTVDHRVPRSAGGHDGLANLVFACLACNRRKADAPEADFLASAWLADRRRDAQEGAP